MPITFACPCGQRLQMADEWAGKPVRCSACKAVVKVPGPAAPAAVPAPPPAPELTPLPAPAAAWAWLSAPPNESTLVALTDDAIWSLNKVFGSLRPEFDRVQAGGDLAEALGKSAATIPLAAVQKVELDKRRTNLVVYYASAATQDEQSTEFEIDDAATRDDLFAALRERLGPGWRLREEQLTTFDAIKAPAIGIVVLIALTALALLVITGAQAPPREDDVGGGWRRQLGRLVTYLLGWVLRPMGYIPHVLVLLVTGVLLAVGVWMIVSRLWVPPLMWYLEKSRRG